MISFWIFKPKNQENRVFSTELPVLSFVSSQYAFAPNVKDILTEKSNSNPNSRITIRIQVLFLRM